MRGLGKESSSILHKYVLMNNGQYAECIAYRGCFDLDIRFEDGTRMYNIYKDCFLARSILHPKLPRCYSLPQYIFIPSLKVGIEYDGAFRHTIIKSIK